MNLWLIGLLAALLIVGAVCFRVAVIKAERDMDDLSL